MQVKTRLWNEPLQIMQEMCLYVNRVSLLRFVMI